MAFFFAAAPPTIGSEEDHKLVVVIYPGESDGAPGSIHVDRAIRSTFANESPCRIEIRNEYVDTSRVRNDFAQAQVSLLQRKYAGRKVDLVIAGLSSGLDFALEHRGELFPGVPIVFAAVDQREVQSRRLPPDVIGVPTQMDLARTLDLALRLHPDTRRVFVVAGSAPFDIYWEAEARRTFRPHEDRLEFIYLTGLSMGDLFGRVADLPEQSLIYYLHISQDGAGDSVVPAAALERLAARANAPIYGHVDTYVGRGIVGGHVFSFETEGKNAARLGLRILAGEKPESIQISNASGNIDVFDWRQLRRWGISEQRLPPGSIIQNKELTFWDAYKWHIIAAASLCLIEAMLIAALLTQLVKRRRAEVAVRESEARFRLMADAAPILIWASGVDKGCSYFNRPWLEFTGRTLEQELGNGWVDGLHPQDRLKCLQIYTSHFDARLPFEMVYRLRRHDGEYRWILDRGVPRYTPDREFAGYVGACSDVTERRRAEEGLRASQHELQLLTGRLLGAQEVERRRIARELHDDVNQNLALVAVEMDLIAASCDGTDNTTGRLRNLSDQVKSLSSSVHDLSHQLHPSKLEQLGLVAAVRGLCKELNQSHSLDIEFTHFPDPGDVPQETALCLYRIVQEALRNVVKHSGSRHARVELWGTTNATCLRITDEGTGFTVEGARGTGGLGLVSMRERLYLVGGEITIESRPSCGTRIEARVPAPSGDVSAGAIQPAAAGG